MSGITITPKQKKIAGKTAIFVLMVILAFVALAPFYWSVLISLRPQDLIYTDRSWLPTHVTWEHYKNVFKNVEIGRYFINTIMLTLVNVATNLVFASMAAYGFEKLRYKGSNTIFRIMILSMMLPGIATTVPTFLLLRHFPLAGGNNILGQGGTGFIGSYLGVLLPGTVGTYGIFFMRQFFVPASSEYAEAGRLDGAGELRIFFSIYIPMLVPALLTLGIFCFQGVWNSYMWPNLILQGHEEKSVLTMALRNYSLEVNYQYGPTMAMSVLMSIPIIVFFCIMQKYFINGVAVGGLKG